jgi:putative peptidoglycan lipid II flippase
LLVFSAAWCLGILNSHHRFFLPYVAPVIWNAAMIATLWEFGHNDTQNQLAVILAWGSVAGSALQVGVQLPAVLRLLQGLRLSLVDPRGNVATVVRNFIPVFVGRGVPQISAYIDALLASLLPTGAVAALSYAQTLYTLPVSLYGMSTSAAELPVMSGPLGEESVVAETLRVRLNSGLRRIAFFVVPSVAAFLVPGDVIVGAIYHSGRFQHGDTIYVWGILAGASVGLVASTFGRLYSSTYYAMRDTRTPLRYAVVRVVLTTILGYLFAVPLPPALGVESRWGVAGLTISAGIASWLEFVLLRRTLNRRIGNTGARPAYLDSLWAAALLAAVAGLGIHHFLGVRSPIFGAVLVLGPYGVLYLVFATAFGLTEAREGLQRALRFLRC